MAVAEHIFHGSACRGRNRRKASEIVAILEHPLHIRYVSSIRYIGLSQRMAASKHKSGIGNACQIHLGVSQIYAAIEEIARIGYHMSAEEFETPQQKQFDFSEIQKINWPFPTQVNDDRSDS